MTADTTVRPSDRRSRSNANERGSSYARRARRAWLIDTYRADVDAHPLADDIAGQSPPGAAWFTGVPQGMGVPACRCYRCGRLLTDDTITVDRIIPGHKGGTYRRDNIRPACGPCNFGSTRKIGRWQDDPEEPAEADDEPWVSPVERVDWGRTS